MAQHVACPKCGRRQDFNGAHAIYWCPSCRMQFDDDPDEGGSFYADPAKRLEKAEERQGRFKNHAFRKRRTYR